MPANGVCAQHMAKETGYIAQTIGFVSMDCVVVLGEGSFEKIGP
jgi:hypothetical protein